MFTQNSTDTKRNIGYGQSKTGIAGNLVKKPIKLSGKDTFDVNKVTNLMLDVIRQNRRLWRKEINDWISARQARYSRENPRNYLLQEVYEDIMLDGQLTGITQNRTFRTTNKDFIIVNKEGKKDDKFTEFIKEKSWFEDFIQIVHETVYYGTGVIWIKEVEKGEIKKVELLSRHHTIPELGLFLTDLTSLSSGFNYREFPEFLVEVQMYDKVGLLEKAAPYTILKRHSWGSWDEFEELYGVPIRIAKIASQSETVKNEVAEWLEEMGSSAYGVFPIGTDIEIKENSKTDAFNVFLQKIQALRSELSMLFLHQTMTTENGSSKSQGTVHENTLKELIYADEKKELSILNDLLLPVMRFHGYSIPDGYKISVAQIKDPSEQIKIDDVFLKNGYVLKQSYIEETYGSEIESMPGAQTAKPEQPKKD